MVEGVLVSMQVEGMAMATSTSMGMAMVADLGRLGDLLVGEDSRSTAERLSLG